MANIKEIQDRIKSVNDTMKITSAMTIVSSGDERTIEQIEKQLNKKLDVIKVKTFPEGEGISRELMLIKVKYNPGNRRDIMENCEIMVPMVGYSSDVVYYERAERFAGESKYPLKKMLQFASEGITSLSTKPIRMN